MATLLGALPPGLGRGRRRRARAGADHHDRQPRPLAPAGWLAVLGVPVVLGLVVLGLALLRRLSLEAAERRTGLVGQLRFAVTVQDLRTVIVLRRQLAQDSPATGRGSACPGSPPVVWRRGWHGLLRFPAVRLLRLVVLAAIAGGCLSAAYHGTAPAVVLAALVLYLVGLDAIEPLSQEIDQSDRADAIPIDRGDLLVRHLPASALLLFLYAIVGGAVAYAFNRTGTALAIIAVVSLPAVWAAGAGAVISVAGEVPAPDPFKDGQLLPPEVAGMKLVFRTAWPVVVCIIGTLPVLGAAARSPAASARWPGRSRAAWPSPSSSASPRPGCASASRRGHGGRG